MYVEEAFAAALFLAFFKRSILKARNTNHFERARKKPYQSRFGAAPAFSSSLTSCSYARFGLSHNIADRTVVYASLRALGMGVANLFLRWMQMPFL